MQVLLIWVLQEILLDIFVYLAGPRLRDKISHHEVLRSNIDSNHPCVPACLISLQVDISSIPRQVANVLLAVCVVFASQYMLPIQPVVSLPECDPVGSFKPISQDDCVTRAVIAAEKYTSLFHPLGLLRREVSPLFHQCAYRPVTSMHRSCKLEELLSVLGTWNDLIKCYPFTRFAVLWYTCLPSMFV